MLISRTRFYRSLPLAGPLTGSSAVVLPAVSYVTPFLSHLKKHWHMLMGERPHLCSHCGKTFMEKAGHPPAQPHGRAFLPVQ